MGSMWKRFLAWSRFSLKAVCELSNGSNYHRLEDDLYRGRLPVMKCRRCGVEWTNSGE